MPQYLTVAIYHRLSFSSRWTFQFTGHRIFVTRAGEANSPAQKDRGGRRSHWKLTPRHPPDRLMDRIIRWEWKFMSFGGPSLCDSAAGSRWGSRKAREILTRRSNRRISGYSPAQKKRYPRTLRYHRPADFSRASVRAINCRRDERRIGAGRVTMRRGSRFNARTSVRKAREFNKIMPLARLASYKTPLARLRWPPTWRAQNHPSIPGVTLACGDHPPSLKRPLYPADRFSNRS